MRTARFVSVQWYGAPGNLAARVRVDNYLVISELVLADGFLYRFIRVALPIFAHSSVIFALVTVGLIIGERSCEGIGYLSQSIICAPIKRIREEKIARQSKGDQNQREHSRVPQRQSHAHRAKHLRPRSDLRLMAGAARSPRLAVCESAAG